MENKITTVREFAKEQNVINMCLQNAKEIENLSVVQDLITAVMAYEEIDKFKVKEEGEYQ